MTAPIVVLAGNTVRVTVTFTPASGTVASADVTARAYETRSGDVTNLTVVESATNVFYADVPIPDDSPAGDWIVRFESNSPSPKIAIEHPVETGWKVTASTLPSP